MILWIHCFRSGLEFPGAWYGVGDGVYDTTSSFLFYVYGSPGVGCFLGDFTTLLPCCLLCSPIGVHLYPVRRSSFLDIFFSVCTL